VSVRPGTETVRLAGELKDWSVSEVRPHAYEADRLHQIPGPALKALESCPIKASPIGGSVDYPRRGAADFDASEANGRHVLAAAMTEAVVYGDVLAFILLIRGRGLADRVVRLVGTPEQVQRWSLPLERGEYNAMAFAMTEPGGGSDPARMRTTARKTGAGWALNGHKHFCSNGALSDLLLVFATVDQSLGADGIRAFVVPRTAPGVSTIKANESKLGMRAMMTTEFALEDVEIPGDAMIGQGEDLAKGLRSGLRGLNTTRGLMGSVTVGIAQAALDEGYRLLREDRDSYSPHRWSAVSEEFDRMRGALERGRQMSYRFASLVDDELPYRRAASVAKAYTCPLAERVTLRVLQHLGSRGYTEPHLIEKWHRDLKIIDIWEGTGNIQRIVVGRELRARV
jgi:alkylation response protein AidB-like acyl-CoA dehydrogenase